jgi:hypothetical protein
MAVLAITFEQLSKSRYDALERYARWLGVTTTGLTLSAQGRRKLAKRIARALRRRSEPEIVADQK